MLGWYGKVFKQILGLRQVITGQFSASNICLPVSPMYNKWVTSVARVLLCWLSLMLLLVLPRAMSHSLKQWPLLALLLPLPQSLSFAPLLMTTATSVDVAMSNDWSISNYIAATAGVATIDSISLFNCTSVVGIRWTTIICNIVVDLASYSSACGRLNLNYNSLMIWHVARCDRG